jgi:Mrp family chromosome partitioning ATPase
VSFSEVAGSIRRHWRIPLAAAVLTAAVLGAYLFTREETREPDTYRTEVVLLVPVGFPTEEADRNDDTPLVATPADTPTALLSGQQRMATSPEVRQATLEASNRPVNDASIRLSSSLDAGGTMTLVVVTPDAATSETVATNYAAAFIDARRQVATSSSEASRQALLSSIETLQRRLADVEAQLRGRIGPLLPPPALTAPTDGEDESNAAIQIPAGADLETTLLLYERNVLANHIVEQQTRYGELAVAGTAPSPFAQILEQRPTRLIAGDESSPLVPSALILLGGAILGIGGAVVADRLDHSIRSPRAAAGAFSAPVLATISQRRRGESRFALLDSPESPRSQAFRNLAATSVATDRLPQAIVVSTPRGDAHDEVAANFAAALASLGVQVALVPTSSSQAWYLDPFPEPTETTADLPHLLQQAHAGRLNGQVRPQLLASELRPNLFTLPPGPAFDDSAPLDGLLPLLEALNSSGIDITVIAGPALLGDANATIATWSTRSVLWAVEVGKVTQQEASEAAARLELAGVDAFGVVVVGSART